MPYADPEAKRANDRRYYLENREARMAYIKEWQEKNPERVATYKKKWEDDNPDAHKRWYEANREAQLERMRENQRRRRAEQPELVLAQGRNSTARYRARRRAAYVESVEPLVVWERDLGVCQICGEEADSGDWHLDHIIPIAKGGEHSYANVQVSHPLCNRRKAASCHTLSP